MTAFGIARDRGADVAEMADRVMAAASAWSARRRPHAERLIRRLVADTQSGYDRDCAGWAVLSILTERVATAFEHGWQPIDLHRFVTRSTKEPAAALLGDAMAYHLRTFARATVDPDWWTQMEAIDATSWWPDHESYPAARGARDAWPETVRAAVELVATIWGVPRIEQIGPLPGHALPSSRGSSSQVDARVLERVRALLAKAESTTFEAEAETFTAGAQSLMARHSIDAALLAATAPTSEGPGLRRVGVDNPYEAPKVSLLSGIASANSARAVWTKDLGYVTLIGHRDDLDAVETLFTSLLVQATAAMAQHGQRTDERGRSRTAAFRRSFLVAFAHRIGERLREVVDAEVATVAGERAGTTGADLVPLLEERREAVDHAVDEHFPHLRAARATTVSDGEGWFSGQAAADRASLTGGGAVEGRP
ncbi:DUF2786 domain-containing protein [Janibacter anophelis]|uniref:DUF2786 domain-containing protein n=1 Tax=Janibacter anophelis TaxID=319054 RepID=UPI000DEEC2E9|nr:DUF2786 domain-containing protein [Janibacter anophelis]